MCAKWLTKATFSFVRRFYCKFMSYDDTEIFDFDIDAAYKGVSHRAFDRI